MDDIVPELYNKIKDEFYGLISSDEEIQAILNGKKESNFSDLALMSRRIGDYAAKSMSDCCSKENLPDGTLYWNILERTLIPLMMEVHQIINELAFRVQGQIDKKQKIGIKPQKADFSEERIRSVMNMISNLNVEEKLNDGLGEDNTDIT